jgi:hypothetical protein
MPTRVRAREKKLGAIQKPAFDKHYQPHRAPLPGNKPVETTGLERFMYLADIALRKR